MTDTDAVGDVVSRIRAGGTTFRSAALATPPWVSEALGVHRDFMQDVEDLEHIGNEVGP
jgi:hypothetical protein